MTSIFAPDFSFVTHKNLFARLKVQCYDLVGAKNMASKMRMYRRGKIGKIKCSLFFLSARLALFCQTNH